MRLISNVNQKRPPRCLICKNAWSWGLVAALCVGCAGPLKKTISIDSEPQGARIEVNGADLGRTPATYTVETNPQGEFLGSWVNAPIVEFIAYPPADGTGLYKQTKSFNPNGFFKAGDRIPDRIFFDMRQKPERLEIIR